MPREYRPYSLSLSLSEQAQLNCAVIGHIALRAALLNEVIIVLPQLQLLYPHLPPFFLPTRSCQSLPALRVNTLWQFSLVRWLCSPFNKVNCDDDDPQHPRRQ